MWAHVKEQLSLQDDVWLWVPVALMLGIGWYFALDIEPTTKMPMVLGCVLLVAACVLRLRHKAEYAVAPLLLCAFIGFGFTAAQLQTARVYTPMLQTELGPILISGRVVERTVGDETLTRNKILLDDIYIEDMAHEQTPRRVSLSSYHVPDSLNPGDEIIVLARLQPPIGAVIPDGFDFRRHSYFQSIGASGFTLGEMDVTPRPVSQVTEFFSRLRAKIAAGIMQSASYPANTVLVALVTGDQAMIPKDTLQIFRDSGLAHLLSVSGVHVGIVCGFVFFTVRLLLVMLSMRIALYWPVKKIAALAALLVGLFYTLLAGADVPTVRAMVMTSIVLVGVTADRITISLRLLALAATLILLVWPSALMGASFQLSFAAMLALVGFYDTWARGWLQAGHHASILRRVWVYILGLMVTSLLASLATTPFTAALFGRTQIYGLLANAVAVPVTGFVTMPALFVALPFLNVPMFFDPIMNVAAQSVDAILIVARWAASLPYAVFNYPFMPAWVFVCLIAGYMFFWLWRGHWRWAGLVLCACAFSFVPFLERPVGYVYEKGAAFVVANDFVYVGKLPTKYERNAMRAALGFPAENTKRPKPLKPDQTLSDGVGAIKCRTDACFYERQGVIWRWPNAEHIIRGNNALYFDRRQTAFKLHSQTEKSRPWQ